MKDYWPYLQNKFFDIRFEKAIQMIGLVKDKIILDLNCGTARMLQYLPEDFTQYIGNDINQEFLEIARKWKTGPVTLKITLHCCRDDEIMNCLNSADVCTKIDIFMNFGINPGVVNKGIESETEFETFKKVIGKFLPEIVICEGWTNYEKDFKIVSQRADFLKPLGYGEVGSFFLTTGMLRTLKVYRK